MTDQNIEYFKKQFLLLWFFCLIGSWSVFPYIYYLGILPTEVSIQNIFFLSTIQSALFFGLVCYGSYKILPKTDLHLFVVTNVFKQILMPGVIFGVSLGLIIFFLDTVFFKSSSLAGVHPPLWAGALASIYGAVNEEVLLRLFLFTFLYFIFIKFYKSSEKRILILWTVNIIVSVIFGLGHLPAALKLTTPSSFEIFRILLLNGIPGLVFGSLYWSKGLWAAMLAHFVTDLMIHVLLI